MSGKLFIIYTAENCGACVAFKKNHLIKLLSLLEKNKPANLKVKHINVASINDRSSINDIHPQLNAANKWFPSFYIFDEKEFYDFDNDLSGHVMGGDFINGIQIYDKSNQYSYDANHIFNWILSLITPKIKYLTNEEIGFLNPEQLFS